MKIIKINLWNQGRWNDGRNITRHDHINIITEGKYFAETLQVEVDCLFTPEILTFPLQPVFFGSMKLTFITSWSEEGFDEILVSLRVGRKWGCELTSFGTEIPDSKSGISDVMKVKKNEKMKKGFGIRHHSL